MGVGVGVGGGVGSSIGSALTRSLGGSDIIAAAEGVRLRSGNANRVFILLNEAGRKRKVHLGFGPRSGSGSDFMGFFFNDFEML